MTAMLLAAVLAASAPVRLAVVPWSGSSLPTVTRTAATFRLTVTGRPGARVTLSATGLARGWLAAFCTPKLCSPERIDLTLPPLGRADYQFELIREDPAAPHRSGARIEGDDGSAVDVPAAAPPGTASRP
jgi:hypothetical protein